MVGFVANRLGIDARDNLYLHIRVHDYAANAFYVHTDSIMIGLPYYKMAAFDVEMSHTFKALHFRRSMSVL